LKVDTDMNVMRYIRENINENPELTLPYYC